jgi:hypothetical protein
MSTDELTDRLRELPPPMDGHLDRFAEVEQRARRRARVANLAIAGTVAAVAAVVTMGVLVGTSPAPRSDSRHLATEPPSPPQSEEVVYETPGDLPGATTVIDLSPPVEVRASGTSAVDLGARPAAATGAKVSVSCLTPGRVVFPDGASLVCDEAPAEAEGSDPREEAYTVVDLEPGQTTLTIEARAGVGWRAIATYVRTETSAWGVNAKGETYGVQRDGKSPDLIATYATNGRQGYAYVTELDGPMPTSPEEALAWQEAQESRAERTIPVYESDGETQIGEFHISG